MMIETDPETFAGLVRTHQKMIHALAYRMTGSRADAEDIAQETFVRAYRNLPEFRGDAKMSSWLYRIALNLCLDWRARARRRDEAQRTWSEEALASAETDSPGGSETADEVQAALLRLPAKQRAVVALTIFEGMSHAQAAALLGCAEATVSWRAFAARRRLSRLLGKKGSP